VSKTTAPWIAEKKRERLRRQKRKEMLSLIGIALLMIATVVGYGIFAKKTYFTPSKRIPKATNSIAPRQ
jgi:hypothetical protein